MSMEVDVKKFLDACEQKPSVENTLLYKDLIVEEFTEFIELSRPVFSARAVHCVVSCALARMRFQL